MSDLLGDWVEVANKFVEDSEAEVVCPSCGDGFLRCQEIKLPSMKVVEKKIYCELCGVENYMRL